MDYYSHHSPWTLDEPLALVGFMGAQVALIGRSLSSRTGLPFTDLERQIEHEAGCSRAQLVMEQGEAARRELEARTLRRVVPQQPNAIVALGDGALMDAVSGRWLKASAYLVYVHRPIEVCLAVIRQSLERDRSSFPEFVVQAPERVEDLLPYLEARVAGYEHALTRIEAGALHPQVVAGELLAMEGGGGDWPLRRLGPEHSATP